MVRRFVEKQQIGLREKGRGEADPHPPAAREFRTGAGLLGVVEAQPGQDARRPGWCRMGVDVGEAGMNLGNAVGVGGGFRFSQEAGSFAIRGENLVEQALRSVRSFLGDAAEAGAPAHGDGAAVGLQVAGDDVQQSRLAGAVSPHQADPMARRYGKGGAFEKQATTDPVAQIIDVQHGRGDNTGIRKGERHPMRRWGGSRLPRRYHRYITRPRRKTPCS